MGKIRLSIKWRMDPEKVVFKDRESIDRTALAAVLTRNMREDGKFTKNQNVSVASAIRMVNKGKVAHKYIKSLRRINDSEIITHRKPYEKKIKPVYARPFAVKQKGGM